MRVADDEAHADADGAPETPPAETPSAEPLRASPEDRRAAAQLLVKRRLCACFPDSHEPDTVYQGHVLAVLGVEENSPGDVDSVLLNAGFEDGDKQTYELDELQALLVPYDEYAEADFRVLRVPVLVQLLRDNGVKGISKLTNQTSRARALFEKLRPTADSDDDDPPPLVVGDAEGVPADPSPPADPPTPADPPPLVAEDDETDAAAEASAAVQHAAQVSQFRAKQKSEYEKLERALRVSERAYTSATAFLAAVKALSLCPAGAPAEDLTDGVATNAMDVDDEAPTLLPPDIGARADSPPTAAAAAAAGGEAALSDIKDIFVLGLRCMPEVKSVVKRLLRVANKMTAVRLMDVSAGRSTTVLRVYHDCHMAASTLTKIMNYAQMNVEAISEEEGWSLVNSNSVADGGSENVGLYVSSDGVPRTLWHLAQAVEDVVKKAVARLKEDARAEAAAERRGPNMTLRHKRLLVDHIRSRSLHLPPPNHPAMRGYRLHALRGEGLYNAVKGWELTKQVVAAELKRFDGPAAQAECGLGAEAGQQEQEQQAEGGEPQPMDVGQQPQAEGGGQLEGSATAQAPHPSASHPSELSAAYRFRALAARAGEDAAVAAAPADMDAHTSVLTSIFETMRPSSVVLELVRMYRQRPLLEAGDLVDLSWVVGDAGEVESVSAIHVASGCQCWCSDFRCGGTQRRGTHTQRVTLGDGTAAVNSVQEISFKYSRANGSCKLVSPSALAGFTNEQVQQAIISMQTSSLPVADDGGAVPSEVAAADEELSGGAAAARMLTDSPLPQAPFDSSAMLLPFHIVAGAMLEAGDLREDGEPPDVSGDAPASTTMAQVELACILSVAADDKQVTVPMLTEVLMATEMSRQRVELATQGIDFSRRIYVGKHTQCVDHKPKNFVQNLAGADPSDHILDIAGLHECVMELYEENPKLYGALVAALEKKTDMQSTPALVYVLICRRMHERLLRKGYLREYAILYALGMAYMAYTMPGLDKAERTRRIELIQALLVYNLYGDRMYLPFGSVGKAARGVRAEKIGGMAATNLLAFLANADARARFRYEYPDEWAHVCETMYSQKDVSVATRPHRSRAAQPQPLRAPQPHPA